MGIGMLLEDFQVGVVLYAERERAEVSFQNNIYIRFAFILRSRNQSKPREARRKKEEENLRAPCDKMHRWIWAWLLSREFRWG